MKLKYLVAAATASIITLGFVSVSQNWNTATANPCAAQVNPCAGANPCAAQVNPCAGANPCAGKNPCAGANPCAGKSASAPSVYIESKSGLAIRGTDPIAYFTKGRPVKGSSQFEYKWQGATWRFSSAENRNLFASNPEAYAPQYGGYCAKALSEGNVVSTNPNAWKIVDGKLYLNYSRQVQRQWLRDVPDNIAKADARWPDVLIGATVFE